MLGHRSPARNTDVAVSSYRYQNLHTDERLYSYTWQQICLGVFTKSAIRKGSSAYGLVVEFDECFAYCLIISKS